MSRNKPRWHPEKPQNNKPLICPYFEKHGELLVCEGGELTQQKSVKGTRIIVLKPNIIKKQVKVILEKIMRKKTNKIRYIIILLTFSKKYDIIYLRKNKKGV